MSEARKRRIAQRRRQQQSGGQRRDDALLDPMQIGKARRARTKRGELQIRLPDRLQRARHGARRARQVAHCIELGKAALRESGADGGVELLGSG